jgi:hypothetical protein
MNQSFIFFLSATLIALLSIVALGTGPIINKRISMSTNKWLDTSNQMNFNDWGQLNCQLLDDKYEQDEKTWKKEEDEEQKKTKKKVLDWLKQQLNSCKRRKAFYGLEYSALIIDIIVGFICSILGLLQYLNEGKSFANKTGLLGLVFGAVGFVITLVYLIYSILVYTKDGDGDIAKADKDGSYATKGNSNSEYITKYYKEEDYYSMIAKYSEYGKRQYNYYKEYYQNYKHESSSEMYNHSGGCVRNPPSFIDKLPGPYTYDSGKVCSKLYITPSEDYSRKNMSDNWLTTIILSALIMLCSICLALFGFLLFKNKEGSNGGEVKVV